MTGSNSIHAEMFSAGKELPQTTEGATTPGLLNLSAEQWATAEELAQLDLQLAGLYRLGLDLLPRAKEPGVGYLIAHAGRELSRGVVNLLTETDIGLFKDTTGDIPDNERNRAAISTILQLPASHSLVTKWFHVHSTFVKSVHFRQPGPPAEELCTAFLQFSELLFGRLGPYFVTHAQLDAFLRIEVPDQATVERIRPMLARPPQRRYFFSNLSHSGWLAPLATAGQFATPPEQIDLGDGTWRAQPWPEGEYLVKMAAVDPHQVTDILLQVPKTLRNPVVWDAVVRTAVTLPAALADRLLGRIENALKTVPLIWFPRHVIPLVHNLASARCEGAFRLAACLLWLNNLPTTEAQEGEASSKVFRTRRETEWVLARIDSYTLGEFLKNALPALEAFKPDKTVELLSKTLNRAVWLIEQVDGVETSYFRNHTSWCRSLAGVERDDDVRAQLAIALTAVATRIAAIDRDGASSVLTILAKYEHEVFKRIKIVVLTVAGSLAQEHLDEIISDSQMLESSISVREYADFLRAQFHYASPRAQQLFIYALERGPSPERVNKVLMSREIEPTEEAIRQVVTGWQSRRLVWFHDQIPDLLMPMAERLGIESKKPSEHDRALNEEGYYSGGVTVGRGELSPISVDQMTAMSPEDLATYLETWRPDTETVREGASIGGLEQVLSAYTAENPGAAATIVNRLITSSISPGYAAALLSGFKEAIGKGNAVPWQEALNLASFVVEHADSVERESDDEGLAMRWRWAASAAASLIKKGCGGDHIPASKADVVWRILGDALRSAATWAESDASEDFKTFYSVLSAALNSLSGHVVEALIDAALWEYRRNHPGDGGEATEESSTVAPRLIPLIEEVLAQDGRAGLSAQAMLGHYVPQLLLLARAWTLSSAQRLLDGGAVSPATRPIWSAYITRSRIYDTAFRDLRPWYVIAADAAGAEDEATGSQDRDWSPSRHLAVHVLVAMLRGLASLGDDDRLVERTFSNVSVDDRTNAYWSIFRSWSDSDNPVDQEIVMRLVRFWEWRLDQLEASADEGARSEEASGLGWLLDTPYVPESEAVRLGQRTIALAGGSLVTRGATLWGRLAELAEVDPAGTYEIAESLISKTLAQDYPYLPFEQVAPTLKRALNSENVHIKERATRLIHSLGDRYLFEYGELLKPDDSVE